MYGTGQSPSTSDGPYISDYIMILCTKTIVLSCMILLALAVRPSTSSGAPTDADAERPNVSGYINDLPRESLREKAQRRAIVRHRRASVPLLVHRGATTLAPENTLEAYAAAMDAGADGVEIDVHRTVDGVLYLMHDDTVDRTTNGSGKGWDMTYYELLQLSIKGAPSKHTRVPTLAAFLQLTRERAMLIHLDVKQPGIQEDIERMIDKADVWSHIVECNQGNAEKLQKHPKMRLLQYKGWIPERQGEPDMDAVRSFLEQPGDMIFCKDVELAVKALGRPKAEPVPLSDSLRTWWTPEGVLVATSVR